MQHHRIIMPVRNNPRATGWHTTGMLHACRFFAAGKRRRYDIGQPTLAREHHDK